MLLAKVLDRLFNRRNTFEVESIEGDINGIPLSDFVTKGDVSNNQTTTVVVRDAVTNLNGYPGASNRYSAQYNDEGYVHYDILYDGEPCDVDKAKRYMKFMSGSDFLPGYEYEVPKQTLFIFPDKSVWKVQYSSTFGLQLFQMSDASVELPPIVSGDAGKVPIVNQDETGFVYGEVSGGTKLYKHTLTGFRKDGTTPITIYAISTDSEVKTTTSAIDTLMLNAIACYAIDGMYRWVDYSNGGNPQLLTHYFITIKYVTDHEELVISMFKPLSNSDLSDTVTEL